MLDVIYKDKPIERFWFLETVARMPYFSYVSTLQLYETLGWWELDSELKKKHYEEEINETHHLKIMESLGGNSKWWNRFIARHGVLWNFDGSVHGITTACLFIERAVGNACSGYLLGVL